MQMQVPLFMDCREQRQMTEGERGREDILWPHCGRNGSGERLRDASGCAMVCNFYHRCDPVTDVDEELNRLRLDISFGPSSEAGKSRLNPGTWLARNPAQLEACAQGLRGVPGVGN